MSEGQQSILNNTVLRLSMGISDEIEDATIAIDETKISEIEATKRRFRNYCVQTKYWAGRPKNIKYEYDKSFDPQSNLKCDILCTW